MHKEVAEFRLENARFVLSLLDTELKESQRSVCSSCDGAKPDCTRVVFKDGPLDGKTDCAESFHSVIGKRNGKSLYMYQRTGDVFHLVGFLDGG